MSVPTSAAAIDQLLRIMEKLRSPEGCPWDREQDFSTIAPYTIEEAYEVADAIERRDMTDLRDELGDLLLQVVFHAQMAKEQDAFTFEDVVQGISDKMISRHPHVFGDVDAANADAVMDIWEQRKQAERDAKAADDTAPASVLDGITLSLPALMRAQKISKRAARTGFDWPDMPSLFDKLDEERDELRAALENKEGQQAVHEELGDLLFVAVNLARRLDVDAETALRDANIKFERRFRSIESRIAATGTAIQDADMDQMQSAWEAVKKTEKSQTDAA